MVRDDELPRSSPSAPAHDHGRTRPARRLARSLVSQPAVTRCAANEGLPWPKVSMEKLLATVIQLKASDLHISVGQPPVVRHHGRLRKLDIGGGILDTDDTTGLMKSHHARPLPAGAAGEGRGRLRHRVRRRRTASASPSSSRSGTIGMVLRRIPSQFLTFEQIGMPEADPVADRPAARPAPGHRADRLGQDDQPGRDDQLHQRQLRPAHHHAGRPDRVLPQAQEVHGQPARDRRRRAGLQGGHPPGAADGPRRHPRRRNARPGDDPRGHRGGRNRPRRLRHAAHLRGAPARSTASSTCSRRTSRTRSARSSSTAAHRRAVAGAAAARSRRGWSRPTR